MGISAVGLVNMSPDERLPNLCRPLRQGLPGRGVNIPNYLLDMDQAGNRRV